MRQSFQYALARTLAVLFVIGLCAVSLAQNNPKLKHKLRIVEHFSDGSRWLNEDVVWIIAPEELAAFKTLKNAQERDQFIEAFWERRDPTPDTYTNEFKEEHYRRIVYANEQFEAGAISGWKTDRGRIYIVYGAPDSIESYPDGKPSGEAVAQKSAQKESELLPEIVWHYRYLEGVGQDVVLRFVDVCKCGEYQMTLDPAEKDALLHVPNGLSASGSLKESNIDQNAFIKPGFSPTIQFKDLYEAATPLHVVLNPLPFIVKTDFVRATSFSTVVPIEIAIHKTDLTFVDRKRERLATVNVFGRLSTLTGHVTEIFEETVDVKQATDTAAQSNDALFVKTLALRPGRYKVEIAIKDANAGHKGIWARGVIVPEFSEDKLSASSPILAQSIEPNPKFVSSSDSIALGAAQIRPYVWNKEYEQPRVTRDSNLNLWMQVYGLAVDERSHRLSAEFTYNVVNTATNTIVLSNKESTDPRKNSGDQVTLKCSMDIRNLKPATYRLDVSVVDRIRGTTIMRSTPFSIE